MKCPETDRLQPRSGERLQPTACAELVEGVQAVGGEVENGRAPKGRKKSYDTDSAVPAQVYLEPAMQA
jgi:hypothetical protein